ncbi:hypothetical protein K439DRAFT_1623336 [Ramaria rubella]|nr:hypothetical protein K439DRAFT_1623336 [Ramaria rubella]
MSPLIIALTHVMPPRAGILYSGTKGLMEIMDIWLRNPMDCVLLTDNVQTAAVTILILPKVFFDAITKKTLIATSALSDVGPASNGSRKIWEHSDNNYKVKVLHPIVTATKSVEDTELEKFTFLLNIGRHVRCTSRNVVSRGVPSSNSRSICYTGPALALKRFAVAGSMSHVWIV